MIASLCTGVDLVHQHPILQQRLLQCLEGWNLLQNHLRSHDMSISNFKLSLTTFMAGGIERHKCVRIRYFLIIIGYTGRLLLGWQYTFLTPFTRWRHTAARHS